MILTVVRSFNWSVFEIDEMYIDGIDYKGLEYWYNDIKLTTPKSP